jgi:hypothetical protein
MDKTNNGLLFINEYHTATFSRMKRELPEQKRNNPKVISAIFIASISKSLEDRLLPFIKGQSYELNLEDDTNKEDDIRINTMIRLAASLLNEKYLFDINELSKLDPLYLQIALNVMSYRYMPSNDTYEYSDNYSITK